MLQGISPLLSPDLLHLLASMGHGDEVALVDANFPAAATAARHGHRLVTCLGVDTPAMLRAVLTVLPLDKAVVEPAVVMEPQQGDARFPGGLPEAAAEIIRLVESHEFRCGRLERFAFYERADHALGIIQTGELRVYGNVILKKGVVTVST
ncbi:MAG: ribose transporter [Tardiphaga sp.]|nr:ribose transporter [Tardiphaga sp.]